LRMIQVQLWLTMLKLLEREDGISRLNLNVIQLS
jgi:hypothetical protein